MPRSFDYGAADQGTYKNSFFNLTIHYDPNWVIQNKEQIERISDAGRQTLFKDQQIQDAIEASKVKTAYLLTIFKYELGSPVNFNPSFIALAENIEATPGIQTGEDYLFHVKKLLGMSSVQFTFTKGVTQHQIGTKQFHMLEGSTTQLGTAITQEYYTTVMNGFALSFILSYNNEEEKKELHSILKKIEL